MNANVKPSRLEMIATVTGYITAQRKEGAARRRQLELAVFPRNEARELLIAMMAMNPADWWKYFRNQEILLGLYREVQLETQIVEG